MTLLDDRPVARDATPTAATPTFLPIASWRLAARLARREVRRRPGRTALVTLLVAVPIMAMTVGGILVRSDTGDARFTRSYGTADLVVTDSGSYDDAGRYRPPVDLAAATAGLAPEAARSTELITVSTFVTTEAGAQVTVAAMRFDPTSPITDGIIEVSAGRLPTAAGEVLLHPDLADELGADLGDTLALSRPDRPLDVVGLGRRTADHGTPLMLFGELELSEVRSGSVETLVDLPPDADAAALITASQQQGVLDPDQLARLSVQTRDGWQYSAVSGRMLDPTTEQLAWGWVLGVLTLTATGIIIAAAFATSARRQLATVGQLAANGASPRLIRRTLSLQGTWSGAVGAVIGVTIGLGIVFVGRPILEILAGHSWTNTVVRPLDLFILLVTGAGAATIAALVPARSLATTSVLSALAGRRPIRPVNPTTVVTGGVCFVAGLFLLVVATAGASGASGDSQNLFALVAVLGGLGILAGVCLASPLAISAATAVASRMGASWRLSARSLHRTRWRSAAVVTAIAVAGAFAVSAATLTTGIDDNFVDETTDIARNQVLLVTDDGTSVDTIAPAVLAQVREVMAPSAEVLHFGIDLPVPSDERLTSAWERSEQPVVTAPEVAVVDDEFVEAIGLSDADRDRLERIGALTFYAWTGPFGEASIVPESTTMRLLGADRDVEFEAGVLRDGLQSRNGATSVLMTRDGAAAAGLDVHATGIRFTADEDLSDEQRRALDDVRFGGAQYGDAWIIGDEPVEYPTNVFGRVGFWITYQWVDTQPSPTMIQAGIIAATLLLVLLVVTIGLSLAAAESRDERNTLIAVGASPSSLRRRSATTAVLLAATGGVLAVPAGLFPVLTVDRAQQYPERFQVPWLSIAAIVVIVPLLVGVIALAGSTIVQRLRPPHVVRSFTD